MKAHTSQFKENISTIGKQLDSKITYELNGVVQTLTSEQLNSITPTYQGAILKSVMKELDLDSNIDIPLGTTINYKFGVLVGNAYEYLDFGNYIVYSSEKQEDYDSYKIVCYDKMLYSMKTNENLGITYPISIRNYIKALCTKIGLEFKNQNETFANYDKMINEELYVGQDYTYRDILDELAQVTASTICLDKNDKVEIRYISNTAVDTIDEKFLKDINVNFGQKYGPVNSIVLSRSAESDNIYLQDEQSVANNGLCEIKIKDNQIMNFNNRSEFLPDILKKLDGLEYYLNDFASTGIAYLELCDRYNIKVFDNTYSCVMFNDELLVTQGLGENVHTDMPEETETDYRKADKEDRKINSAFLIVDKQLGEIRGEVTKVESKVEDITTTTQTSIGGNSLYLKEALESNALEYSIDGKCEQDGTPTPDAPVEIKSIPSIRNLFDKTSKIIENRYFASDGSIASTSTINNFLQESYIEVNPNTDYILFGDSNSKYLRICEYDKDKTFIKYNNSNTANKLKITTQSNTKYIRVSFVGANALDVIQLEEGSTVHDYVPYGAWTKVKITGANKFNIDRFNNNLSKLSLNSISVSAIENGFTITSSGYDSYFTLNRSTNGYQNLLMEVKPNVEHALSYIVNGAEKIGKYIHYYDKNYNVISTNNWIGSSNLVKFTPPENTRYCFIRFGLSNQQGTTATITNIMLSSDTTDYEPYKEKEVLIDLAKENLFDKDNANILNTYPNNNILTNSPTSSSLYIECEPNTTYTVSRSKIGKRFRLAESSVLPAIGGAISNTVPSNQDNEFDKLTITTSTTAKYLVVFYSNIGGNNFENNNGYTEQELRNSIKIYKGTNADDSYELNSIGDIKDKLEIVNGVAVIQKKIGKIVLNGSENWSLHSSGNFYSTNNILSNAKTPTTITEMPYISSTHFKTDTYKNVWQNITDNAITISNDGTNNPRISFDSCKTVADFKVWLQANPVTVYYILNEPETITLPNTNIPLYEGVNHVTLVEDLETTTSIKYLRKTPISGEYALNQDLNKTNSNLADTNNQLSQTQSDIDNTKTNLNNNYYNKEQVDSINSTTTQNITQIRNTMEQNITSTNASISKIQEEITNGVSKVTTTTGTFDENGLNISKSGQQMSSTLDWDGLEVVRDKGKATETEVLTVRSAGVEAENMTVRNFFIKRPIRIEKCKSITDSTKVGLGFFWIGE